MNDSQPTVPLGLCQCGCGRKTRIAHRSNRIHGFVKGQPLRYIHGHSGGSPVPPFRYEERDCGYTTPCWVWLGSRSPEGYGRIGVAYAHRISYERHVGPIPEDLHIDHLCRNKTCVNPEHLEPVTQAENQRRATAKLTREDVWGIREAVGSHREIAARFGVDKARVSRIKSRKLFADVPDREAA